jgi:hypothetical protein
MGNICGEEKMAVQPEASKPPPLAPPRVATPQNRFSPSPSPPPLPTIQSRQPSVHNRSPSLYTRASAKQSNSNLANGTERRTPCM